MFLFSRFFSLPSYERVEKIKFQRSTINFHKSTIEAELLALSWCLFQLFIGNCLITVTHK